MQKQIIVKKRGFFGWVFLLLFLGWNALMGTAFVCGMMAGNAVYESQTDAAAKAGAAIGGFLGMGSVLFVWLLGALIFGLLALLTRSGKTVIYNK